MDKTSASAEMLKKPAWIKVKYPATSAVIELKKALRKSKLVTVCEEAACPNIGECFSEGTATFMILGDICTRRCSFCDVAHGRPLIPDSGEPQRLAESVRAMALTYVVITSVDRDDLMSGGSQHFVKCIKAVRSLNPGIRIEILVPDFRKKLDIALEVLAQEPPDVFNHNIETVPRLYYTIRPGSDYQHSLNLLHRFKQAHPKIPTKSGLMLGLGETNEEVIEVLKDLHDNGCDLVTIGQYLQPSKHHAAVQRYVTPAEFESFKKTAYELGFKDVASGPLVRSSYHADRQSRKILQSLDANETSLIKITVNGEQMNVSTPKNITDLVIELGFGNEKIATEINGEIIPHSTYQTHLLDDADRIEIVRAVGGGET